MPAFSFFLQPYKCSKGFEACRPHFRQTMQLHEQRMKLKLSMQSNARQWRLHITQNTIEAHVRPHKHYVHACAWTETHPTRARTLALIEAIVSHSAQVVHRIRPRASLCSTLLQLKDPTISICELQLMLLSLQSPNKETRSCPGGWCSPSVSKEIKAVHCHLVRERKADKQAAVTGRSGMICLLNDHNKWLAVNSWNSFVS